MNKKPTRIIFLASMLSLILGLAVVAFIFLAGPNQNHQTKESTSAVSQDGDSVPFFVIPVVLVVVGLSFLPFMRIFFPTKIKNGVVAEATVMKVWDTGVSINDNPQVGMLLDVHPPTGTSFQAETKKVVSRLNTGVIQPGVQVQVFYDPANLKRLVVQSIQGFNENPTNVEARLNELKNLQEKNLITAEEYQKKREEIIKSL
jgi:hypothetical protein